MLNWYIYIYIYNIREKQPSQLVEEKINYTIHNKNNNLPFLNITGDILDLKEKKQEKVVKIDYASTDINFSTYAKVKIQGQFTLEDPKKNYNINFYKDKDLTEKEYIDFKWGSFNKYTIKSNYKDSSQSRNVVTSNIVSKIYNKYKYFNNTPNNGSIDGFPIEVYINDKYHGLYTLNLNKENMFYEPSNKKYTLISNQTIYGMRDITKETSNWENFEVEVGEENEKTLDEFNRLLEFIHTSTDEEFKRNIENYLDLDLLLTYYCYVKYAGLWDNLGKNLYFLTYDGKIWYTVFYDLDHSFGSHVAYTDIENRINEYTRDFPLWNKLEKNFGNELSIKYEELRNDIFKDQIIIKEFENFINTIPEDAYFKDKYKWPDSINYQISDLENFLQVNTPKTDAYFNSLKTNN